MDKSAIYDYFILMDRYSIICEMSYSRSAILGGYDRGYIVTQCIVANRELRLSDYVDAATEYN